MSTANDLDKVQRRLLALQRMEAMQIAFLSRGDPIAGLWLVRYALQCRRPVPAAVARWLDKGLDDWLGRRADTLDDALGLKAQGRADPRRRNSERVAQSKKWKPILEAMLDLQCLGATVDEAAALACTRWTEHKPDALADRYKRSGYGSILRALRAQGLDASDALTTLSQYPTPSDRSSDAARVLARLRRGNTVRANARRR